MASIFRVQVYLTDKASRRLPLLLCFLAAMVMLMPCSSRAETSYRSVAGPCRLEFPRDHGPHPGYATEWWYYTGNVKSGSGSPFGFQLTFFRHQFVPPGDEAGWPKLPSAWRTPQIYIAHLALSDIMEGTYRHVEQMARGAVGLADATSDLEKTSVFVKDWSLEIRHEDSIHHLTAVAEDFGMNLILSQEKPPVLHGQNGYSLKGKAADSASCYYSLTRMSVHGDLVVRGQSIPVQGSAWMDHEFSTAPLEGDLLGWDWFSLQFSDRTELMIYLLRQKDGGMSPASSGTFVDASGTTTALVFQDIAVEALDHWQSPHSGGSYPVRWAIKIIPLKMELTIAAQLKDQEMNTPGTTRITYWEGSVSVKGNGKDGKPVTGEGYVELTGYDKPLNLP